MALFKAGQSITGHPFVPRELVADEPWGEIWRARNSMGSQILIVAYTTPEGDALFEAALSNLRKWKEIAEAHAPHLLKILEVSESAIPYLIVEDPEGKTLREHANDLQEPMAVEEQLRLALGALDGIIEGESHGLGPLGLTPDTIFLSPRQGNTWRLLPVAPGTKQAITLLAEGRYFPKEITVAEKPALLHADCYALAWSWVEAIRRDFKAPWPEPEEAIPLQHLRFLLQGSLVPRAGYSSDPGILKQGLTNWSKTKMAEDTKLYEAEIKKGKRGALAKFFGDRKGGFGRFFIFFAVVAGLMAGGFFTATALWKGGGAAGRILVESDLPPAYFKAIAANQVTKAVEYTSGLAQAQTRDMYGLIDKMESLRIIQPFARASVVTVGTGPSRISEATLVDQANEEFAVVRMNIMQDSSLRWSVVDVYFKQVKYL